MAIAAHAVLVLMTTSAGLKHDHHHRRPRSYHRALYSRGEHRAACVGRMIMFTREMRKVLEADGLKLKQLTGEDHGPYFMDTWETCPDCGGDGEILEARPQHDDPGFCVVHQCEKCGGSGWVCQ
jgi:hypothetical protein